MATLTNIDAATNRHRFYSVATMRTLFGDWHLVREWGRIGSPGTVRCDSFASEAEANEAQRLILRTRKRHGYR